MSQTSGDSDKKQIAWSNLNWKEFREAMDLCDSSIEHNRVVVVEGRVFYVQEGILSLFSEYFKTMFNSQFKEASPEALIEIKDVAADNFKELLTIIYPTQCPITAVNVLQILVLADRFVMPSIMLRCKDVIIENFDKLDKLELLDQAFKLNLDYLKDKLEEFFKNQLRDLSGYGVHLNFAFMKQNEGNILKLSHDCQQFIIGCMMKSC